jgi:hypothetical protein
VVKYQLLPPIRVSAWPVPCASAWVSQLKWKLNGEHALPVMSELPATVSSRIRSFSRINGCSASAEPDVEHSTTASTCCVSIHSRAMETAMSGLF